MPCIKSVYVFNLGWILKLKKKKTGENFLDSKKVCEVEKKKWEGKMRIKNSEKEINNPEPRVELL